MLLVLPACSSSDAAPPPLPPITAPPTPTPTPASTPSPSVTPDSAKSGEFDAATQAAAEQFVRDWWAAVNNGLRTGSSGAIAGSYLPSCAVCAQVFKNVDDIASANQHAEGGDQRLQDVDFDTNSGRVALVNSIIEPQPGRLVSSSGKVVRTVAGGPSVRYVFNLLQGTKDDWVIQDLLVLSA